MLVCKIKTRNAKRLQSNTNLFCNLKFAFLVLLCLIKTRNATRLQSCYNNVA